MAAADATDDASHHMGKEQCSVKPARHRAPTWRLIAATRKAVLAGLGTAAVANATARLTVDSGWQSFVTGGGIDGALP
jgi:hypothetical protein